MPTRLRIIKRVAKEFGLVWESAPGGGSHGRFSNGSWIYPIPGTDGDEVPDVYIKGLCRTFAIDLKEFKKKL